MIRINKLHSTHDLFKPIDFTDGINLILGEKVTNPTDNKRKNKKTNGVGKSLSIEFINFALLKDEKDSRVMKIPLDKIPNDFVVKLDISIDGNRLTIARPWNEPDKPTIFSEDGVVPFNKVEDALQYLHKLVFKDAPAKTELPSFRELISLCLRDEDSEFKNIINPHNVNKKIPNNNLIGAHLYFFGIDLSPIKEIKKLYTLLENDKNTLNYLKKRLTNDGAKKISNIKSEINSLENEIKEAEIALEKYESQALLETHRAELLRLDSQIEELRVKQTIVRNEIRKIESMPAPESINISDVEIVYNKFKDGLGTSIGKSFKEVLAFKEKIERYQNELLNEKLKLLKVEVSKIFDDISRLDERRGALLTLTDNRGILKDFKNSFSVYSQQKDILARNISDLEEYESIGREVKKNEVKKDNLFLELDAQIFENQRIIKDFEKLLVEMHMFIMGNAEASFEVETINTGKSKTIINVVFRIEDDGSHSVDRTKVFMYDVALMLNKFTNKRHPSFLIHDNIFDVDQDTLVQCLNYLDKAEKDGHEFQYILTLNRDKIESEERRQEVHLDIDRHRVASFDRENTFLKFKYKEQ